MGSKASLILLLFVSVANASVVTNTMCTATGFPPVSDPTSCEINNNGSTEINVRASITPGELTIGSAEVGVNSVFTGLDAVASPSMPPPGGPPTEASALATGSAQLQLTTVGPVRSGFIRFSGNVSLSHDGGSDLQQAEANISVGPLHGTCTQVGSGFPSANCTGDFGLLDGMPNQLPFTLGQAFVFSDNISLLGTMSSQRVPLEGPESGTGSLAFSFTLTESDGTPVQIFAVPEPGAWSLILLSGLALAAYRYGHWIRVRRFRA